MGDKFSLEQRAKISASHRFKRGTPEWHMAYTKFIESNGVVKGNNFGRAVRQVEINAAIFASHHAPKMRGLPIWEKLYRNYIERQLLLEEVKEIKRKGAIVNMEDV